MAQLTRPALHDEIDGRFPDNDTQLITPPIVRAFLHNLVDSALLAVSDTLTLSKALTLAQARALLTTVPPSVQGGQRYAITGSWNGLGTSTVYVDGLSTRAYGVRGVLFAAGTYAEVLVDVVAGTALPATVDAYTKQESDAQRTADQDEAELVYRSFSEQLNEKVERGELDDLVQIQQQHTTQLATLGAQAAPAMCYLSDGTTVGFASLDEALADKRQKVFMRFNVSTLTATVSNILRGSPASGWPNYLDASGSTIFVKDGVVLSLPGDSAADLLLANFFFYLPPTGGTGVIKLLSSQTSGTGQGQYPTLLNGYSQVPINLNGGTFTVLNGWYAKFTGSGTLLLYGNAQVDTVASGITVVDHRGASGGGGYTDVQARAAPLNRTAPAGTTTVTLTAEAPRDYGTAASGTFTVDATGCVVGVVARFALGAGAQAPAFSNAPAGQPYKFIGVSYASGKAFSYSLLVCVDRIEVVTLAE